MEWRFWCKYVDCSVVVINNISWYCNKNFKNATEFTLFFVLFSSVYHHLRFSFPYLPSHIKIAIRLHDLYFLLFFSIISNEKVYNFLIFLAQILCEIYGGGWTKMFVKCFTVFSLISLFRNDNKLMPTFVKRSDNLRSKEVFIF